MTVADFFPGATAVSQVRVYDWPTVDGLCGGSPHLHTICTEGYLVVRGSGVLETLSGQGYGRHALAPGVLLWFGPGTVHRLVNTSGDLEITVVMQNAGLPEAGDAVFTFPPHVLDDFDLYARAATLSGPLPRAQAAQQRRDLAVEGYLALRDQVIADGPAALADFYRSAGALVRGRVGQWRRLWRDRALAAAVRTGEQLDALADGQVEHLASSAVHRVGAPERPRRFGMCGHLSVWDLEAG